jgi:hypothetical protein
MFTFLFAKHCHCGTNFVLVFYDALQFKNQIFTLCVNFDTLQHWYPVQANNRKKILTQFPGDKNSHELYALMHI